MRWGVALLLIFAAVAPSLAAAHKPEIWARAQFEIAEKLRSALHAQEPGERSRHDYLKVIDAYRRVYYGSPSSSKADPSVAAEAALLCEMGRQFHDEPAFRKAIREYEFLRREYPGSKSRVEALFTIGEIYRDDLGDPDRARSAFEEFVHRYPHHQLADQARQALSVGQPAEAEHQAEGQPAEAKYTAKDALTQDDELAPPPGETSESAGKKPDAKDLASSKAPLVPLITGILHWSMSDSTRVAIRLQDVDLSLANLQHTLKYKSQHLSHPDRIYFDLLDTRLTRHLNGKSFAVDDPLLKKIRIAQFKEGRIRVVLEVEDRSQYDAALAENPARLVINIRKQADQRNGGAELASAQTATKILTRQEQQVRDLPINTPRGADLSVPPAALDAPHAIVDPVASIEPTSAPVRTVNGSGIDRKTVDAEDAGDSPTKQPRKSPVTSAVERSQIRARIREAQPTASGDRSLIRALGLKIGKIVIDPGHGGHDTGTIGSSGLTEKDLVLDVSLRLGKLLESRLGAEVDYTRADDTFVPLETRTAIANQDQADLFVSVHANSSRDPDARGVETYYLNFTTSRDALDVAARENAVSDQSIYELQDLVKKIALKEKIEESREFAADVQNALHSGLSVKNPGLRDRGVKRAPFIVLIGANMPSILAEISFVSNPGDESKLKTAEYRQRIAESLYRGISKYVSGLSGVKVASKMEKSAGQ